MERRSRQDNREAADHPVILFDGVCNLCNGLVEFIIRHDPEGRFRFAAMQTKAGEAVLKGTDGKSPRFDSVMLIAGEGHAVKSDAMLRVASILGGPWKVLALLRIIPRRIRDVLYDIVAARRYHWFGTRDACPIPDDDVRNRFL